MPPGWHLERKSYERRKSLNPKRELKVLSLRKLSQTKNDTRVASGHKVLRNERKNESTKYVEGAEPKKTFLIPKCHPGGISE